MTLCSMGSRAFHRPPLTASGPLIGGRAAVAFSRRRGKETIFPAKAIMTATTGETLMANAVQHSPAAACISAKPSRGRINNSTAAMTALSSVYLDWEKPEDDFSSSEPLIASSELAEALNGFLEPSDCPFFPLDDIFNTAAAAAPDNVCDAAAHDGVFAALPDDHMFDAAHDSSLHCCAKRHRCCNSAKPQQSLCSEPNPLFAAESLCSEPNPLFAAESLCFGTNPLFAAESLCFEPNPFESESLCFEPNTFEAESLCFDPNPFAAESLCFDPNTFGAESLCYEPNTFAAESLHFESNPFTAEFAQAEAPPEPHYFRPSPLAERPPEPLPPPLCFQQTPFSAEFAFDPPAKTTAGCGLSSQSTAARERRRRISDNIEKLRRLIPGGGKMSTAEMLEAAHKHVRYLHAQISNLRLYTYHKEKNGGEDELLQVLKSSAAIQEKLSKQGMCFVPKQMAEEFVNREINKFRTQ